LGGLEGLKTALNQCGADIAVNGIAGIAGLAPSVWVLENGIDLALANKESVVSGWEVLKKTAKTAKNTANGGKIPEILPVDSEHSAVFSLINAHCGKNGGTNGAENPKNTPDEIILTASGGPFLRFSPEELKKVTVADALAHPTWSMGKKITIDSASLANKGLEVIEAVRLFNVPPKKVKVVVQAQSIVHSLIRLKNGALYAEMSKPDMKLPIYKALCFPDVRPCNFASLNFDDFLLDAPLQLSFCKPDFERFPMLDLAYKAAEAGAAHTIVYNAANEVLVQKFIDGVIGFTDIPRLTAAALEKPLCSGDLSSLDSVLELDSQARSGI